MNKKNKKDRVEQPSLDDEQLEILSNRIDQLDDDRSQIEPFDTSAQAEAIRYAKKNKLSALSVIISAISLLLVIAFVLIFALKGIGDRANTDDFLLRVGSSKYTLSYDDIVIEDVLCMDMTYIADLCAMTVSGDADGRKYTLSNAEYIRFENGSDSAIVNGEYIQIGGFAKVVDDKCLVPYDFISKVITGLTFSYDAEENIIKINRITESVDKNNVPTYAPLSFTTAQFTESFAAYEAFGIENMSELISAIDPENPSDKRYLLLVNHDHPLSSSHVPSDLKTLRCATNPVNPSNYYSLRADVATALEAMMSAVESSGVEGLLVSSTYRSYERQEYLYDYYIESKMKAGMSFEAAKKEVLKTLALPGHSEHQTGLCIDFVQGTSSLTENFENGTAFKWLSENAHKFGFILRYPKGKEGITGYDYEPWHYRYVGRTTASKIYEAGLTYEEYVRLA